MNFFLPNLLKHKRQYKPCVDKLCLRNGQVEETETLMECDLDHCPLNRTKLCAVSEGLSRSSYKYCTSSFR